MDNALIDQLTALIRSPLPGHVLHRPHRLLMFVLLSLAVGSGLGTSILWPPAKLLYAQDSPTTTPISSNNSGSAAPVTVALYDLFELQFNVGGDYKNPFDLNELQVDAVFRSPSQQSIRVPAFWMQPYRQTCQTNCQQEVLESEGQPAWRVRFTPSEMGEWQYLLEVRTTNNTQLLGQGNFTVTPPTSTTHGFIRVGENRRYFAYDDGTPFFLLSSNLGWSWDGANGVFGYQRWMEQLARAGVNHIRLYVDVPWFIGLDWRGPAGNFMQAQADAWKVDAIMAAAKEYGIAVQMIMLWYQGFTIFQGLPMLLPTQPARPNMEADWTINPYNPLRGGPVASPQAFFVDAQARAMFKRRLRYAVARWGYSPQLFAWEVVDAADRVATPEVMTDWLQDMTAYLREVDPYHHLLTAGVRNIAKANILDPVVLDMKQVRFYQRRPIEEGVDQVTGVLNTLSPFLTSLDRPVMLSEFSLNPWFEPADDDPTGVHVVETMWASALSGAAGAGASAWWDTYVLANHMEAYYAPLYAFAKDIPWSTSHLEPTNVALSTDDPVNFAPITVGGFIGEYGTPPGPDVSYRITPDGVVPPLTQQSAYIYGLVYNATLSRPQRYIISPPVNTTLTVKVRRGSEQANAQLVIVIDGQRMAQMTITPGNTNLSLSVPIEAGQHEVQLDNLGDDFLQLDSITIDAYITPLRTVALADRKAGIFLGWFQHRDYTWQNVAQQFAIQPVTMQMHVANMPPGNYRVELWDPLSGNIVGQEEIGLSVEGNRVLTIKLLPISNMLAVRAIRVAEPGNLPTPSLTPTSTPRQEPTLTPTP